MLLKAKYEDDKIRATHVQRIDEQVRYSQDLAKDRSNGFSRDRNMRRIGSFPTFTLSEYDRTHPGFLARIQDTNQFEDKQAAWREFLKSDYAKPFMMVEKLKH